MRARIAIFVALGLAVMPSPGLAQDADALRKELSEMRRQFETMKGQYERALETLGQRLQRLEASPTLTATPAAPAPPVMAQPAPAPTVAQTPPAQPPTLMDLARPREPFSLYGQRGPGQLLFDIGVVSDFVGNLTQRNVDKANAGTFFGRENRFLPREVEVNLYGRIDPYAQGHVRFEFAEEFEGGQRSTSAKLAEAFFSLLDLPFGTKLSLGQLPVRFGLASPLHREALPQADVPNALLRFLGEEQFREAGAELSWVAPLPFYLEGLGGVFNGDNATAFGRSSLLAPLVTGRLRTFFELGDTNAMQLGLSGATGETGEKRRSTLAGLDLKYKLTPDAWRHPLLTLGGETLWSRRKFDVSNDEASGEDRTRHRFGWYGYGEVQPWKRWAGGVRYDSTEFPINPGREWAIGPYLSFMPSDFLRFRLGYKHTERSHRDGFTDNGGSARVVDEVFFQTTFFLGAHQPHPF